MSYYFSRDYAGPPFVLFGTAHVSGIAVFLLCIVFFIFLRHYQKPKLNTVVRVSLATVLIAQEVSYHLWRVYTDEWSIHIMLPLHICTLFVWLGAFMLLTKNRFIYDFAYFIGIAGASQAFLTPDISDYGFPHFRFFHVLISHGSIMLAPLYMTIVECFRPTWKSLAKVFLWSNVYLVFVFIVNWIIGSNYMFVNHKPETASLLDVLGPWPLYLIAAEGVALVSFLILYLPFAIGDWRWKHAD